MNRSSFIHVATLVSLSLLLTACFERDGDPAELVINNTPSPYHIVKKGETVNGISSRYGISRDVLVQLNSLKEPYKLFIGQKLVVRSEKAKEMEAMQQKKVTAKPNVADTGDVEVAELGNPAEQSDGNGGSGMGGAAASVPTMGSGVPGSPTFGAATGIGGAGIGVAATGGSLAGQGVNATGGMVGGVDGGAVAPQEIITPGAHAMAPVSSGTMMWPVRGQIIKSYGDKVGGQKNDGINIGAPSGTPVLASDTGTVLFSGNQAKGYGNLVILQHANKRVTVYGHLNETSVKAGQSISSGQQIGSVGTTGGVSEPQVHFEVREGKTPKDPTAYLQG